MSPRNNEHNWRFDSPQRSVAVLSTRYAPVVYFKPTRPKHILVLAFGFPWDKASDAKLLDYARLNVKAWSRFAETNNVLIVAPVMGGTNFAGFRDLSGRLISADVFIDRLIDGPVRRLMPKSNGRFCIHGHSAGAQFVARYIIAEPERLECAVLSAPSTYAMPSQGFGWPYGMGSATTAGGHAVPAASHWLAASTGAPISVIVGSRDTEWRPDAPGQVGHTRHERGRTWVAAMQSIATSVQTPSHVQFVEVPDQDHNEPSMAKAAQEILHQLYANGPS